MTNSAVANNTAALARGRVNNNAGTTTLKNSSVTGNAANTALLREAGAVGGGIFTFSGTVPLNVPGCAG